MAILSCSVADLRRVDFRPLPVQGPRRRVSETPAVLFSVVIPTYNRPERLHRCLLRLSQVHFPGEDFEVIVVDDGSSCCLESSLPPVANFRLLRQENAGPGAARNYGARKAQGRYLVFLDDDCIVELDWLSDYARAFETDPKALWGGKILTARTQNFYCHTAQWVADTVDQVFNSDPGRARFFSSNNFALDREAFLRIGGFSEKAFRVASEDREFCDRWSHRGGILKRVKGASIFHEPPLDLKRYCRMYFNYGRGAFRYHQWRTRRNSGRLVQDARFHLLLPRHLSDALRQFSWSRKLAFLVLVLLWQLFNGLGFAYQAIADKVRDPQGGPDEEATLSADYGAG